MIEKYQKHLNDITNDQMCINMLEGASFSSGATIILPSGRKISGEDANILVSEVIDFKEAKKINTTECQKKSRIKCSSKCKP